MKGKSVLNFLAYISIAFIAVALVVGRLLGWLINPSLLNAITLISQFIAYALVAVFAFYFAKSKKSIGWMVAYIIFVVVIIIFMILNIF